MSPFLAQVQVINVAGGAPTPGEATETDPNAEMAAAVQEVNAATDQLKAQARARVAEAVKKVKAAAERVRAQVRAKTEASAENPGGSETPAADSEDKPEVVIKSGGKSIVVHHRKSSGEDIPAIVFPITTVTLVFLFLIVRTVMAPFTNRNKRGLQTPGQAGLTDDEQAVLVKLQRTLAQMESRVESLETILIEQHRNQEKYGSKL